MRDQSGDSRGVGTRPLAGLSPRAERRLLAIFPLVFIAAWWLGEELALFAASVLFPAALALHAMLAPDRPAAIPAPAVAPLDMPSTTAAGGRDALTGLATRSEALVRIARMLDQARISDRVVTAFYIDLDRFDSINKRYGLSTGDMVLRATADRLRAITRDRDLIARIDGDAFVIALAPSRRPDTEALIAVAARMQKAVSEPLSLERGSLHVTCTIGLCQSDRAPSRDAQALLAAAEAASDSARLSGPGSLRSFSPRMKRDVERQQALVGEIEAALENGQIRPWFQPQMALDTGRLAGFEALARWEHPEHGLISPAQFLPAIEAAGRNTRLTEIILQHSAAALRDWDKAGVHVPNVGINFATEELRDPRLVEKIKWTVERYDIAPARISIEVLETVFTQADDDVIACNIRALAKLGFRVDLDDFGTGHASISNIRRFTVDRLKIDRSFITHIDTDAEQRRLAGAIIRMAEGLGLEALAEGVETEDEADELRRLGCRYAQGYALARPMPLADTMDWLRRQPGIVAEGPASTPLPGMPGQKAG
ncbi:MAG: bifunctional diguanylate cyclase/phosphodiesterase [Rhodobacteraceae bacterium]|nr:bifunctional diguanylate cyclase/phosphodiesterase [Paracoccaceae bacterium]